MCLNPAASVGRCQHLSLNNPVPPFKSLTSAPGPGAASTEQVARAPSTTPPVLLGDRVTSRLSLMQEGQGFVKLHLGRSLFAWCSNRRTSSHIAPPRPAAVFDRKKAASPRPPRAFNLVGLRLAFGLLPIHLTGLLRAHRGP